MSTVNVGTLIDLGISATKTSVSSSQESGWASSYVSGRTTELINEGYSPSIAEQMTYCEIGLKISLDLMASGTTTAIGGVFGGFVGDAFAGPFGIVPGQWIGSGLGMWAGNLFSGVDQAMAQAMTKQAFGGDNPEDQDIDLSKIPAYMSSTPMKETPGLFQQAEAATEPIPGIWRDPLLVDLDGDGIETTTLQNGTYFDHDKNGFAQESAWVGADDGVLAFDKNADGVINNGGEIFGDNYVLSNGQTATTGFQALADLDSNSDGVINSSDTNFASIKVMKGNGTLETLTEAGIASINLTNTATNTIDSSGNTQLRAGTYTKTDNTTGVIGDYSLAQDVMYSISTDWVDVSTEIAALPDINGYGTVDSLHQAMAKDTTGVLQGLVEDFIAEPDISQKKAILTNIIYKWTGADAVSPTSRGTNINGQKLYALEKFMGENFVGVGNAANPNYEAANFLNAAYSNLSDYICAQLASQTYLKPVYDLITMQYDETSNKITMDLTQVAEYIRTAVVANEIAGRELLSEFDKSFKILGLKDSSNYSSLEGTFVSLGTDYKFLLDTSDKALIYGTSGDDYLNMHKHKILICQ